MLTGKTMSIAMCAMAISTLAGGAPEVHVDGVIAEVLANVAKIKAANPNASVDAGYGHAIALIMANAASRTGMKATFCTKTRQVIVNGKPFIGYNSLATGKCS